MVRGINRMAICLRKVILSDNVSVGTVSYTHLLKDASATAVFGVRGANGVILVTTRRGKEGKAKISVNSSVDVYKRQCVCIAFVIKGKYHQHRSLTFLCCHADFGYFGRQ